MGHQRAGSPLSSPCGSRRCYDPQAGGMQAMKVTLNNLDDRYGS